MKDKGYILPEVIGGNPTTSFCMTIPDTREYRAAFWGAVWDLGKWFTWEKGAPGDTRARDAALEWRQVIEPVYTAYLNAVDCGSGEGTQILLRQNPDNLCELQQSIDDGETWTTAFRYDLCVPPYIQIIFSAALLTLSGQGSGISPGESWIYDPGDTPADVEYRRLALCYAVKLSVDMALDLYIQAYNGALTPVTVAAIILALITLLVLAIGAPVVAVLAVALADAVLWVYLAWTAIVTAVMANDPDIRQAMYCAMFQHLLGRAVSLDNFKSSFNDAADCLTGDNQKVAGLLEAIFNTPQVEAVYDEFRAALSASTEATRTGYEPDDCTDCAEEAWCKKWQGDEILTDFDIIYGSLSGGHVNAAPTLPGDGWGVRLYSKATMYIPVGTTVTQIQLHYCRSVSNDQHYYVDDGNGTSVYETYPATCADFGLPPGYSKTDVALRPMLGLYIGALSSDAYIDYIVMSGTGVSPFGICNDC